MLLTCDNTDDIRRYFCESFVKFKETGDFLWYLQNVDGFKVTGVGENGDELLLYLDDKNPFELDYVLPHKSYFQLNDLAVLLYRIPAKQYHRGLSKGNTAMCTPMPVGAAGHVVKATNVAVSFETLKAYVNKQRFLSLDEAVTMPHRSTVIGKRLAYVSTGQIVLDTTVIGVADRASKKLKVVQPIFMDELRKLSDQSSFKLA